MLTSRSYSLPGIGAASVKTSGDATAARTGYARINSDGGSLSPSGVAIIGFRSNNILVSEVGVPASSMLTSARMFAEVSSDASVNTGIGIANPGAQPATIRYTLTNTNGVDFKTGTLILAAGGQLARFLTESPFESGTNILGTFSVTSDVPVSIIALRGFTNQRSEFLITTLPLTDSATIPVGTQVLPHFAAGGGWTTQVVLVNPTDALLSGNVRFMGPAGEPVSNAVYTIAPRSAQRVSSTGSGSAIVTGSVRVDPDGSGFAPVAFAIFSYKPPALGITVTEAGIPAVRGNSFRIYAESTSLIQTGVALTNAGTTAVNVRFELYRVDGTAIGSPVSISLLRSVKWPNSSANSCQECRQHFRAFCESVRQAASFPSSDCAAGPTNGLIF
jgi:hypothetical protein